MFDQPSIATATQRLRGIASVTGYFLMHRGWQENPIFDREEYSRRDAWVWLIENATWKPSRTRVKGEMIDLDRANCASLSGSLPRNGSGPRAALTAFSSCLLLKA